MINDERGIKKYKCGNISEDIFLLVREIKYNNYCTCIYVCKIHNNIIIIKIEIFTFCNHIS